MADLVLLADPSLSGRDGGPALWPRLKLEEADYCKDAELDCFQDRLLMMEKQMAIFKHEL